MGQYWAEVGRRGYTHTREAGRTLGDNAAVNHRIRGTYDSQQRCGYTTFYILYIRRKWEQEKEGNKSDRLKSVIISPWNLTHGAEIVFKKTETTPSVLKRGRAQRFRDLSHRKQTTFFLCADVLAPFSSSKAGSELPENSRPPFPVCVLPRPTTAAWLKEKQHQPWKSCTSRL